MALNSIEKEWQGFAEMVVPPGSSAVQRDEMKRAFFAGAWAMLTSFEEMGEDHVSEEEGIAFIQARNAEAQQFKTELLRRYSEGN